MKYWEILKVKWGVETDRRMGLIFFVFAVTGSATLFVRKFLYKSLNIDIQTAWLAVVVKILAIYLIYQLLLISIGTLFGERKFFTWFIKKMNYRLIGKKPS
jgi:Family of unknown function (DUF6787)